MLFSCYLETIKLFEISLGIFIVLLQLAMCTVWSCDDSESQNDFLLFLQKKFLAVPLQNTSVKCHKTGYSSQESEVRTDLSC